MNGLDEYLADHGIKIFAWLKRERFWLGYLLLLCFISFAYELFNFTLSIDEEFYAQRSAGDSSYEWVRQGRWSMFLISFLFPVNPIVPFMPLFFTLICSALSFTIVIRIFSAERTFRDYVVAPLFIACPTLYYVYSFNSLNYGIGIGFLASASAVYIFQYCKGIYRWGAAVLLIAFVIGIYQAFMPWLFVLFCFSLLRDILESHVTLKELLLNLISIILVLLVGLILYFVISQGFRTILKLNSNDYINSFVKFQFSLEYLLRTVRSLFHSMVDHYLGRAEVYDQNLISLMTLFVIAVGINILKIYQASRSYSVRLVAVLLMLAVVISPYALNFISGGVMPTRALLAIPLTLSGLVYFAFLVSSRKLQVILFILCGAVIFQFITINNRFAFADYLTWQADRALTLRIMSRLDDLPYAKQSGGRQKRIYALVGHKPREYYASFIDKETIGASFYEWDEGSTQRVIAFMKSMGITEYRPATRDEHRSVMKFADEMPIWPTPGSVALKDGISIVKLGNYTHSQLAQLCDEDLSCSMCRIIYNRGASGIRILDNVNRNDDDDIIFKLAHNLKETQLVNASTIIKQGRVALNTPGWPQLILPALDNVNSLSVILHLNIETPAETTLFFFYRYPGQTEFTGEHQMQVRLDKGKNSLIFSFPTELLKEPLRIDPGLFPGTYQINQLEIIDQHDNSL